MHLIKIILLAVCLSALPVAAQYRHVSLNSGDLGLLPRKVLVIPADVSVRELSAGGLLTKVPELTQRASANLSVAGQEVLRGQKSLDVITMPENLTDEEKVQLEGYLATFFMVGIGARQVTANRSDAWEHKRSGFDYSLGRGLQFLKDKTGADAALLIVGEDIVSTGGRQATVFLGALVGINVPLGSSNLFCAMVDLSTGNLLWVNTTFSISKDLADSGGARNMMYSLLDRYPGAENEKNY